MVFTNVCSNHGTVSASDSANKKYIQSRITKPEDIKLKYLLQGIKDLTGKIFARLWNWYNKKHI